MKKTVCIIICLSLAAAAGCGRNPPNKYQADFLSLFDTVTSIVGYSDSKEHFRLLAERIKDKLEEYHRLYDIYHDYAGVNNLKTVNDNAGKKPVKVDKRILDLLLFAKNMYEATDGSVNIALGSVLSVWHEYRAAGIDDPENSVLPPFERLAAASEHTDINDIVLCIEDSTVFLHDALMSLDVGAIAKGYALEQTALFFEREGIDHLLISIGGNVRAVGNKIDASSLETPWVVGIRNPDKESAMTELMSIGISECSLVSSGAYERYYTVGGITYHHIINPRTLMPSDYFAAVTILCRDSGTADILSTAIFNMPLEQGRAFIDSLGGTEALWVLNDGTLITSDGFMSYEVSSP